MFVILTRSTDRDGRHYVSTIESPKYPVTATQWHAEKAPFEWAANKRIPHDSKAIRVSQYVANFLASEARMSAHRPAAMEEEEDLLIYNFNATYTGRTGGRQGKQDEFEQVYFFPPFEVS